MASSMMAQQRILLNAASSAIRAQQMNKLAAAAAGPSSRAAAAFSSARTLAARQSPVVKAAAVSQQPYVKGTVNDATTFPPPSKVHGSYHWTFERLLSASLVPVLATTAVTSANPILDGILCVSLIVHSHIGFDSILVDYLHPRKFPLLGPIMTWTVRILTGGALYGLYEFNTNDIGLTELVKKSWKAAS